jgi:hypothetical protein
VLDAELPVGDAEDAFDAAGRLAAPERGRRPADLTDQVVDAAARPVAA